jgi:hypothetical protein
MILLKPLNYLLTKMPFEVTALGKFKKMLENTLKNRNRTII